MQVNISGEHHDSVSCVEFDIEKIKLTFQMVWEWL